MAASPGKKNPMITVCIMLFSLSASGSQASLRETRCGAADAAFLKRAQVTCDAAKKDPVGSCDAFHTSDGSRWLFVHQVL